MFNTAINEQYEDQLIEPFLNQSQELLNEEEQQEREQFVKETLANNLALGNLDFFTKVDKSQVESFFKSLVYKVDLSLLYSIVDTCYYSQAMPFCPMLVENNRPNFKEGDAKYHLLVWSEKGELVFEKELRERPITWCITFRYLIFKPHQQDQLDDEQSYYIIDLLKNQRCRLDTKNIREIESIEKPKIGFCNKCLYISDINSIYIFNLSNLTDQQVIKQYRQKKLPICKISLGPLVKNHGFLIKQQLENGLPTSPQQDSYLALTMCCETDDSQFDFAMLIFYPAEFAKNPIDPINHYIIKQISPVVARKVFNDPVIQFRTVLNNQADPIPYSIALRKSKSVDIYWNFNLKDTIEFDYLKYPISNVELNFFAYYLEDIKGNIRLIELNEKGNVCHKESRMLTSDDEKMSLQQYGHLKSCQHNNIFQAQCLIGTSYFAAHAENIYIYDLLTGNWVENSFSVKSRILWIFPQRDDSKEQHVFILMEDGSISMLSNLDQRYLDPQHWYINEKQYIQLPGNPKQLVQDQQRSSVVYLLTLNNQKQELHVIYQCKIYAANQSIINFQEYPVYIMQLQYNQIKSQIACYVRNPRGGEIKIVEAQIKVINKQTQVITNTIKNIPFDDSAIQDNDIPHNCIAKDIDDTLVLVGKKNLYRVNVGNQITEVIPECNIISVQVIDIDFCYVFVQDQVNMNNQNSSGMKIFSLTQFLQNNAPQFMNIENTVGSKNNNVGFTADSQRIIYTKNSETIHIVPPLHRTTINFMGMASRNNYLATNKLKDKFFALDKFNTITTWDSSSGKLITSNKIQNDLDLQNFSIFGFDMKNADMTYIREWNQPFSLIISSQEANKNINLKLISQVGQLIDENQYGQVLRNDISGCKSYPEQEEQSMRFKHFKVIEIKNETTVAVHMQFVHHYFSSQKQIHKIIISNDCQIMIEKLINQRVNIYKRNQSPGNDEWNFVRRFTDFPHELSGLSQNLYLFSPDLSKFLDIDSETNEFVIKNSLIPVAKEAIFPRLKIGNLIMEDEKSDLTLVTRRFKWINNKSFLFCSKDGLEMRYEVDYESQEIIEISSSQIPAFFELNDSNQIYVETLSLSLGMIKRRLFRKHQQLKRQKFIFGAQEKSKIMEALISIDYNIKDKIGMIAIELPFSWILWKITEQIAAGKHLTLDMLDNFILQAMCLNIMPGGKTILHKFNENSNQMGLILSKIPVKSQDFEMPFIADLYGKTRLHYCMDTQDTKTAGLLINYLADAPLDHHSRDIQNLIPDLIKLKVPYLTTYLDKRIISTQYISQITRGAIKTKNETFQPGMIIASIWANKDYIKEELFQSKTTPKQKKRLQTEVQLFFVDLPGINDINSAIFNDFFQALKDTDNIYTTQVFQSNAIKCIIEYHWRITRYYTLKSLFLPFFIYLLAFFIYTNFTDELIEMQVFSKYQIYPWLINIILLVVLSIYFIKNEINQIFNSGWSYFIEPWNYIDLVPPIVVLAIAFVNTFRINTPIESILKSVGSLFMWLKLLYFLRIYKTTGYLVRMIVQVIQEMKVFLLVLFITIIAVADSQISIQPYDKELDTIQSLSQFFIHNINRFIASVYSTYQMILGGDDFVAQDQYQLAANILIVFTKLFVMIVMLNLVISIIGDTFGRVKQNSINEFYKEISCVISENSYLVPSDVKQSRKAKPGELLLVCKKLGDTQLLNDEVESGLLQQTSVLVSEDFNQINKIIEESIIQLQENIQNASNNKQPPQLPGQSIILNNIN